MACEPASLASGSFAARTKSVAEVVHVEAVDCDV